MLELFQITGSASFAARAALEEAGADYLTVDVHPRRRDETPGFAAVNPLRRVPAVRDGDVTVYETAAVLAYVAERYPDAGLGPRSGDVRRAPYLRWLAWLGNTLHDAYQPVNVPHHLTDDPAGHDGIRRKGREQLDALGRYLDAELAGREWCLGDRFSVADIYLYMLVGWQSYVEGGYVLGGDPVQSHYARVGARPGIARARELDDLDERLIRYHPELRGGKPIG
jgi:glutathione S-transferase